MQTTRPKTRHEREQIHIWVKRFLADEAHEEAKALVEANFVPIATRHAQCCLAADDAVGRFQETSVAADAQDAIVEGNARRWLRSVTDERGFALTSELKPLLGINPAAVLRLPHRESLSRLRALMPRLPTRLQGDPEARAALNAAMDVMEPLLDAHERARGEKLAANQRLHEAESEFDAAWGKQVRLLKALLSEEALRQLPAFTRKGKASAPS